MADRYWVGGAGTWNSSSTTNWSATSGGASGASAPVAADSVFFDANSGSGIVSVVSGATYGGTLFSLNNANITVQLMADLAAGNSTSQVIHNNGTLDLNGYVFTTDRITVSTGTTRTLAFGSTGKIVCTRTANITFAVDLYTVSNEIVLTGTPTFDFTGNFSASSGFRTPLSSPNPCNVYVKAGTGSFNFGSGFKYNDVNFTGFAGTLPNAGFSCFGNLIISSGMTLTAGASSITFAATSGTQQVTTAGKTLDFPIGKSGAGSLQLQDNLTMGSTRTFTLTAGTLDLNNQTLSAGAFLSSNTNTRAISFGIGNITLTGNAASVVNFGNNAGLTISGTPVMNLTYAGAVGTRTITYGTASGSEARSITMNITAGSDIIAITNGSNIRGLNFTGFTGSYTNAAINVYGDVTFVAGMTLPASANTLTFAGTSTQNLTSGGQTLDFPIGMAGIGGGIVLQDACTIGSTRTLTQQHGTLNLNGNTFNVGTYSSAFTSTRSVVFGSATFNVTNNSATCWNVPTLAGWSYTGTPNVNATYSGGTGTRTFNHGNTSGATAANAVNILVTAGTDTITANSPLNVNNLNFTGFNGTLANIVLNVYGSLTYSAGMTVTGGGSGTNFISTTAGNTITSNGKTMDFPVTFNGVGGVWTCQDALTLGSTRALTLTNGTLNLKAGATSTVGSFITTGTNQKYLGSSTPGTQATISDASGVNSVSFLTIQDSLATGGADWEAYASNANIDAGNNLNWDFGATPILGTEYEYKLRSFTQPRRF